MTAACFLIVLNAAQVNSITDIIAVNVYSRFGLFRDNSILCHNFAAGSVYLKGKQCHTSFQASAMILLNKH